jgi:outer membrane protein assembly factor BamB
MIDGTLVQNDIRFHGYKLTITDPEGNNETKTWDIVTDTTSSAYTTYTPTKVGTYTLTFEFPGQVYTWSGAYQNDTYLPSSKTITFTVQEDPIEKTPETPLPTEYWSRPINGINTAWASLASNFLYPFTRKSGYLNERLQPDGTAPDTAHIMWTKQLAFGGVVGGSGDVLGGTEIEGITYYSGLAYEHKFSGSIIMNGRLYYNLPRSNDGSGGGYACVNLRTGEEIWQKSYTVNPSFGQLLDYESANQHGVISNGYLWATQGTTWIAYDPWDGNWLFNMTNVPADATTSTYYTRTRLTSSQKGEMLVYVLNVFANNSNNWLAVWNNSVQAGEGLSAQLWRPVGKINDMSKAYSWNVTIPALPSVGGAPTIRYLLHDDILLGSFGNPGGVSEINPGCTIFAISLKPSSRGSLLWIKNYAAPKGNLTRGFGGVDPVNRVFTMSDTQTGLWYGYSLDNGNLLWSTTEEVRGFQYYSPLMHASCAYGNLYIAGWGGELFCYSTKDGKLQWKYNNTSTGADAVWGLYPIFIGAICDDKVYLYTSEHSPNAPPYKSVKVRCINATTGEEIWTMLGWAGVGSYADYGIPVADDSITYLNVYDMQIYCLSKGPSETTVTAPNNGVALGSSVVISGTVMDISAGSKQEGIIERFPKGLPAVSDESMSSWMEYVYMQQAKPTNATGVPVKLYVLDSNENYRSIGTATTDTNGFYSYQWIPDIEGKYTVYAVYEGSESYYGSQATAAFAVDEPVATATPQATQPPSAADLYLLPGIASIIVTIIAFGIAIILLQRKRP